MKLETLKTKITNMIHFTNPSFRHNSGFVIQKWLRFRNHSQTSIYLINIC